MTDPQPKLSKAERRRQRAAEEARLRKEAEARRRRRALLSVLGVVVAMAVIIGGAVWLQQSLSTDPVASESEYSLALGEAEAPHEVVIYEDFLCPFCGALETELKDGLTAATEDGRVRVEYRPFVLLDQIGPYSADATEVFAVVLETAGPEVAKTYHDLLFEQQPPESGPFPSQDDLVELAVEAGADEEEVRAGIEEGIGEEWADGATEAAQDAGVSGTPTVFLDGEVFQDGRTVEEMAANLLAAVE